MLIGTVGLDWVNPVIQLATAGGFGALVWYLVLKHIPNIESRHYGERTEWREYIEKRDSEFQELIKEHSTAVQNVTSNVTNLRTEVNSLRDTLTR